MPIIKVGVLVEIILVQYLLINVIKSETINKHLLSTLRYAKILFILYIIFRKISF